MVFANVVRSVCLLQLSIPERCSKTGGPLDAPQEGKSVQQNYNDSRAFFKRM